MNTRPPYDHHNCSSLFDYSAAVHVRSGGTCELCGAGDSADFDWWRQLTVEHLIGKGQGGYLPAINKTLKERYPELGQTASAYVAYRLDTVNTVSACHFCNETTSRTQTQVPMTDLILQSTSTEELIERVTSICTSILASKRADVKWKLDAVKAAWNEKIAPNHVGGGTERLHTMFERNL